MVVHVEKAMDVLVGVNGVDMIVVSHWSKNCHFFFLFFFLLAIRDSRLVVSPSQLFRGLGPFESTRYGGSSNRRV